MGIINLKSCSQIGDEDQSQSDSNSCLSPVIYNGFQNDEGTTSNSFLHDRVAVRKPTNNLDYRKIQRKCSEVYPESKNM